LKKIFLILFISLFLSTFVQAQNATQARDFFYTIEDFSGMLNSHTSRYLLQKSYAQQALNVRPNDIYGALVKRPKMFLLTTAPTSAIKSLYRYYKADDNQYTIATYGTHVDYYDAAGTQVSLYESATDSRRWSFVTYKDMLIGTNGSNNVKKWDGKILTTANTDEARTAGDLIADLGAPYAELNTGTNLDASSWYQYKVAFYDGSTYTYSDARSNPILTGADVHNITLTDIPLGPTGTTHRYIYRTVGNASRAAVIADTSFYKVATIADNSTVTYNDVMTDATLVGDAAPAWDTVSAGVSVTVPKAKYMVINTERLFLGNDPTTVLDGQSTVYWSDALNPNYFYIGTDYELIRPDDGDEITFMRNLLGILTIGKTRTISKFYTTASSSANWSVSDPFSHVGCVAPYSAVDSTLGIIYLGRYGIFNFNGQNSELISDSVTDKIRDILPTNVDEVVGVYHDNRYLMSYTSEESGATNNNTVLVFDLIRNAYYIDTKNIDSFANFDSGLDFGTLYSGSSLSDGNIYAHQNAFNRLIYRYKSQLSGGTVDSVYIGGTESDPTLSLGDSTAWEDLGAGTWADSGDWTWTTHTLSGYWYSPAVQINATELDQLYWNESLGANGDISVYVRLAATEAGLESAAWSSAYSDPSGSDLSGETANVWIQFRVFFENTTYTTTPVMFVSESHLMTMTYKKEGTTGETSILSVWESGVTDLGYSELPKRIKEMQVFYEGTEGTLTVTYSNEQGDSYSFDIDLSVDPTSSTIDQYFGTSLEKIYVHFPGFENVPNGRFWTYKVEEDGTEPWTILRIMTRGDANAYTTFK
jgi:hypothetical protein